MQGNGHAHPKRKTKSRTPRYAKHRGKKYAEITPSKTIMRLEMIPN